MNPHAHEFSNNAMAKTSLLIVTELGAYRSKHMGLIDILNGMQNGPRGPSQASEQQW